MDSRAAFEGGKVNSFEPAAGSQERNVISRNALRSEIISRQSGKIRNSLAPDHERDPAANPRGRRLPAFPDGKSCLNLAAARPSSACRCATPSRLAAGPTIFLPEARGVRLHPASARLKASSTWRSSSSCFSRLASGTSMPPYLDAVLAGEIGGLCARLVLPQHPNNLLFRKPGSLHLSFLQKAGL